MKPGVGLSLQAIADAWEQDRSVKSVIVAGDSVHATLTVGARHYSNEVDTHEHPLELSATLFGTAIEISADLPCFQR